MVPFGVLIKTNAKTDANGVNQYYSPAPHLAAGHFKFGILNFECGIESMLPAAAQQRRPTLILQETR